MKGGATPLTNLTGYALLHELIFDRNANVEVLSTDSAYGIVYKISLQQNQQPLHEEYGNPIWNYILKIVLISPDPEYVEEEPDVNEIENKRAMSADTFIQEITTQKYIWEKTHTRGNPVCPSVMDEALGVINPDFFQMLVHKFPDTQESVNIIMTNLEKATNENPNMQFEPVFMLMNMIHGNTLHVLHHLPNQIGHMQLSMLYQHIMVKAMRLYLECNIGHTDLHSNNIIVDEQMNPFIIDFGNVKQIKPLHNKFSKQYYRLRQIYPTDNQIHQFIKDFSNELMSYEGGKFEYILDHLVQPFDQQGNLVIDEDLNEYEISVYHAIPIWNLLIQEMGTTIPMFGGKKKPTKCNKNNKKKKSKTYKR